MVYPIEINYMHHQRDDGLVCGKVITNAKVGSADEKEFEILYATRTTFQDEGFVGAKDFILEEISGIENVLIHPVLFSQLILIFLGAGLVFHRDKAVENTEANFQSAYFRFPTLISTFSNLLSEDFDNLKSVRKFKGNTLKGLSYKHVEETSISGMAHNILKEMRRGNWLEQSFLEKFGPYDDSKFMGPEHGNFLIKQVMMTSLKRRSDKNRMTGEWLVFEKVEEKIHLLTLASHQESDERIKARINGN